MLLVDVAQINRADVRAALVVNDDELRYVAGLNAVVKPVEVSLLGERSSVYKVFVNRGGVAPSYDIGGVSLGHRSDSYVVVHKLTLIEFVYSVDYVLNFVVL